MDNNYFLILLCQPPLRNKSINLQFDWSLDATVNPAFTNGNDIWI